MSTTVVHPESVSGNGPSGRTIGMAVAGLVLATGLGFAIANQSAPEVEVVGSAQVDSADIKYQEAGATRTAAEAARRQEVLQETTSGVSQGTAGAVATQADRIAHTESLAGELQALHANSKPTNQAIPWTEFVNGDPVANAVNTATARTVAAATATQADRIAHTESLAGELQALHANSKPTNQAIPWTEFVNGTPGANAQNIEPGVTGIR